MSIIYDALKKIESKRKDDKKQEPAIGPSKQASKRFNFISLAPIALIFIVILVVGLLATKIFLKPSKRQSVKPPSISLISKPVVEKFPTPEKMVAQKIKPSPAPTEDLSAIAKKLPSLIISGIFFSDNEYTALINDKLVIAGDSIEGVRIDKIDFDGVQITFQDSSLRLDYP